MENGLPLPTPGSLKGRISVAGPLEDHLALGPIHSMHWLPLQVLSLILPRGPMQTRGRERHTGTLWGKGKLGIGRGGVGEEASRCHARPSSFWCCPRTNSIPWKAPSKTKAGALRQAAQGPNKEIGAATSGLWEKPYVFRIPRACSNSCRLCCT